MTDHLERVGRYRLVRCVGQGGMGRVWLARDELLDRDVAVKEVLPRAGASPQETAELHDSTLREARAAARLDHPNVVRVHDVITADGRPWIVMQYVPSRSLHRIVTDDGPLPPRVVARIGVELVEALRAAHRVGVLHRDVTPRNVLVAADGRALLGDFGVAAVEGAAALSRSWGITATPQYVAPERVRRGVSSPGTDLWALGATLYTAVEGRPPYRRDGTMATLLAMATEPPDRMRRAGPLAPVVGGLLARDERQRLTAGEAARMLRRVAGLDGRRGLGRLRPPSRLVEGADRTPGVEPSRSPGSDAGEPRPATADDVTQLLPAGEVTQSLPVGEVPRALPVPQADRSLPSSAADTRALLAADVTQALAAADLMRSLPAESEVTQVLRGGAGTPAPAGGDVTQVLPGGGHDVRRPPAPQLDVLPLGVSTGGPDRRTGWRSAATLATVVVALAAAGGVAVAGVRTALGEWRDGTGGGSASTAAEPAATGPASTAAGSASPGPPGGVGPTPAGASPTPTGAGAGSAAGAAGAPCLTRPSVSTPVVAGRAPAGSGRLPAGWLWHRDRAGFAVALPAGWTRDTAGAVVCLRDRAGARVLAVQVGGARAADPSGLWRREAERLRAAGGLPGYERISIGPVIRPGGAAEWEYTWDGPDGRLHARRLVANGAGAAGRHRLVWVTADGRWPAEQETYRVVLASFRRPG
ncbi:serine/threonine-protein kinase [Micromonospora robiginosa]|uniref:non-specific serine/threonine protein kinase n=1 Tax=Micromonospora robiginosa TaxID=2749844 RepID=A0A7L6B1B4_9ACTN|nr:serine/threonine-protein kinase [Micromonospora ferruginea]QLQ35674.2 serine/threonine-protein kinase [Micromonospora ferruginea]